MSEPRTHAGRQLIAAYPANAAEAASPEFIRHQVAAIRAIEAEASLLDADRLHGALAKVLPGSFGTVHVGDERREVEAIMRAYAHAEGLPTNLDVIRKALQIGRVSHAGDGWYAKEAGWGDEEAEATFAEAFSILARISGEKA